MRIKELEVELEQLRLLVVAVVGREQVASVFINRGSIFPGLKFNER